MLYIVWNFCRLHLGVMHRALSWVPQKSPAARLFSSFVKFCMPRIGRSWPLTWWNLDKMRVTACPLALQNSMKLNHYGTPAPRDMSRSWPYKPRYCWARSKFLGFPNYEEGSHNQRSSWLSRSKQASLSSLPSGPFGLPWGIIGGDRLETIMRSTTSLEMIFLQKLPIRFLKISARFNRLVVCDYRGTSLSSAYRRKGLRFLLLHLLNTRVLVSTTSILYTML